MFCLTTVKGREPVSTQVYVGMVRYVVLLYGMVPYSTC
jgi:hypothetical protein